MPLQLSWLLLLLLLHELPATGTILAASICCRITRSSSSPLTAPINSMWLGAGWVRLMRLTCS
jgi:hypothetical protein